VSGASARRLPRAVIPIYLIIFIDVLGFTFLIPLLGAIVERFQTSTLNAGLLISTTAVCATISSPFWGRLSDLFGRKPILLVSQFCSLAGYTVLALAGSVAMLFVSRAVQGLGGGNLGVAQSYIIDVVEEDQREKALAYGAAAFGLGFIFGPVLSGLIVKAGLSAPFWAAAGLELINIVLTVWLLPATQPHDRKGTNLRLLLRHMTNPVMTNVLVRQFLYIFSFTYFFTAFSLFIWRELHLDAPASSLLLAFAGGVGAVTLIFGAERLERRLGAARLAESAFGAALVSYVALGFATTLWGFLMVIAIWAFAGSLLRPTLNKLIADAADASERGALLGFSDSLDNFALIISAPIAAGVVSYDARLSGVIPGLCAAIALVLGWSAATRSSSEK